MNLQKCAATRRHASAVCRRPVEHLSQTGLTVFVATQAAWADQRYFFIVVLADDTVWSRWWLVPVVGVHGRWLMRSILVS